MRRLTGPVSANVLEIGATPRAALSPDAAWSSPPGASESMSWDRAWRAIHRRRWIIAFVTLASGALGYGASRMLKPQYLAQSMIWIDQDSRRAGEVMPLVTNQSFDAAAWADLVRSAQVLDTVVARLALNVAFAPGTDTALVHAFSTEPSFVPGEYELDVQDGRWMLRLARVVVDEGVAGAPIGVKQGFKWAPTPAQLPAGRVHLVLRSLRDASRDLDDALNVHISPEGNFLRLSLVGTNRAATAATLGEIGRRYITVAEELKRRKLSDLTSVLHDRLGEASKALHAAEDAFAARRSQSITEPSDPASAVGAAAAHAPAVASPATGYFGTAAARDELADAQRVLARATRGDAGDIEALEGNALVMRDAELSGALKELVAKRAELRALASRYEDTYPPVQRLAAEVDTLRLSTIPSLARRLSASLQTRRGDLDARMGEQATTLRAIPGREVEEARLRRNVESSERLVASLQEKYDAARVADESHVSGVRILDDAAAPTAPYRNTRLQIIALALMGGLGLSLAGAVAHDRVDPRVRYPQQVAGEIGLPVLGVLPRVPARSRARPWEDVPFVEAMRAVRVNLGYAHGTAGPMVVTVSSPGSADGKSFVALQLARAFAESGKRTILVDADLRRGAIHRATGLHRRPGLADTLSARADEAAVIRRLPDGGPDIITSGTRSSAAPDLLGRASMARLLASLRARYDVIICDSPPLSAGIDAFLLAAAAGHLLLVLRSGVSPRRAIPERLEVLERMPVRVLGAVLNDVRDADADAAYTYYLPGYEAEDEHASAPALT